jgi:NhaP-type Na+/H+ or K+/H+ antiporter
MLTLKEEGYGQDKDVPTMMLAGASLDNVTVITMFTMFLGFAGGENLSLVRTLLMVPWSLILGIIPGLIVGFFLVWFFEHFYTKIRATEKVLLLLGISITLVQVGEWINTAALLGIMTIGFVLLARAEKVAEELSLKLGKLWVFSEIILFVLIGMSVQIDVALRAGPGALLLITGGLAARSLGVLLATAGSSLNRKEKLFSVIAYLPKATVQAALGAVPLQKGVAGGELILAYAVVAIIFTAPLGLIGIRKAGPRLLHIDLINESEWEDIEAESQFSKDL